MDVSLLYLGLSLSFGMIVGAFAGLLPGVHVNNTSAILLGLSPAFMSAGISPLYVAVMIIVSTVTQSFLDIIPSIFLGAPDEAYALAALPGHRMLLEGRGVEAVRLSALGSGLAIGISLLLIWPLSLFFDAAYGFIQQYMAPILIAISAFILLSNHSHVPFSGFKERVWSITWATAIFLVAGIIGIASFSVEPYMSPLISIAPPSALLPLLSGLFGAPALLMSLRSSSRMPVQYRSPPSLPWPEVLKSSLTGTVSGALVSWFPAVSAGVATSITGIFSKKRDDSDERYIVSASGVNTSGAIFSLVALYVILRPRSGAVVAAQELLGGTIDDETFRLFLLMICVTGVVSYLMVNLIGEYAASMFARVDYALLNKSVLAFLAIMCLTMTGPIGLVVFIVATLAGLAPHMIEVRKTCLMGALLLPCIIYFL